MHLLRVGIPTFLHQKSKYFCEAGMYVARCSQVMSPLEIEVYKAIINRLLALFFN